MTNEDIEDLLARARSGAPRLSSTDRQRCVAFLTGSGQPKISNIALGKLFGVSEGQIRADKKRITRATEPAAGVKVTLVPDSEPLTVPEGYELVHVETYEIVIPFDETERKRRRSEKCKRFTVHPKSIRRMVTAAILSHIAKGKL